MGVNIEFTTGGVSAGEHETRDFLPGVNLSGTADLDAISGTAEINITNGRPKIELHTASLETEAKGIINIGDIKINTNASFVVGVIGGKLDVTKGVAFKVGTGVFGYGFIIIFSLFIGGILVFIFFY